MTLLSAAYWDGGLIKVISDHKYILFEIGEAATISKYSRNLKKVNWDKYREFLNLKFHTGLPWHDPTSYSEADEHATRITEAIQGALDAVCPEKNSLKRKAVPWWSKELSTMRKATRKAFKKAKSMKNPIEWEAYRDVRKIYEATINYASMAEILQRCRRSTRSKPTDKNPISK